MGIIVLNWNGASDTLECLASIEGMGFSDYRVYVVENGSTDDSPSRLRTHFEEHHPECSRIQTVKGQKNKTTLEWSSGHSTWNLLLSPENKGFSGGCNLGIHAALTDGASWVFLLNNDASIGQGVIPLLLNVAIRGNAPAVCARMKHPADGRTLFQGQTWPGLLFGSGAIPQTCLSMEAWESGYLEGSALLLSRRVLDLRQKLEGYYLDPGYFLYCEDTDLCRWIISHGDRCLVVRDAWVDHRKTNSSGGEGSALSYYYITRNRVRLACRWLPMPHRIMFLGYYFPTRLIRIALHLMHRDWHVAQAVLEGTLDGLLGRPGIWRRQKAKC
ncbi:MAG: glycosyltransferase family 2 protein [Holophagaceae bacterium]|uniref:Glycosyltransferase family 2 protein n=1 Tax=Candidatus Geothrix skivensis TaxID=2954439 RepID=A0A9D7XJS3_9BACT|nr:glycosyltransferase family 2 protein [Candidatus Geothrix skivensis]